MTGYSGSKSLGRLTGWLIFLIDHEDDAVILTLSWAT
jgi:hypothetical protein